MNNYALILGRVSRLVVAIALGGLLAAGSGLAQDATNSFVILQDHFAARPAITLFPDASLAFAGAESGAAFGSNSNATMEAGEPYIAGVSSGQTVWGSWTPPTKGILTLTPAASSFSPLLAVYAGMSLAGLVPVTNNTYEACYSDGDCGCHERERSQITLYVSAGQPYQFCMDSAMVTDASWVDEILPTGTYPTGPYQWAGLQYVDAWSFYVVQQTTNVLSGGPFDLGFAFIPAPKNDDFTNASKLVGPHIFLMATNFAASKEPGEPDHQGNTGGSSVWYAWTAAAAGQVTLSTNYIPPFAPPTSGDGGDYGLEDEETLSFSGGGTIYGEDPFNLFGAPSCGTEIDQNPPPAPPPFYPLLGVYTGTRVDALTSVNPQSLQLAANPGALAFDAVQGQTYQIAYDGNLGSSGVIPLYLDLTPPAVNSTFNGRIALHGVSIVATGYNVGASPQPLQPLLAGSIGKIAWWSWHAPVNGKVSLDLTGSEYSFPVGVFTGNSPAILRPVAAGMGGLTFQAVAGTTYQIAVGDVNGLTGGINLRLQAPIVDLPLRSKTSTRNSAILTYGSVQSEVAAFISSNDNVNWQIITLRMARGSEVQFVAQPPPAARGPFYRAIIFDLDN